MLQPHFYTSIPINILSFSAITNFCVSPILNFSKIISKEIDLSVNSISSYSLESSIDLIKTCSETIVILTVSSKIVSYILTEFSNTVVDYDILLEDQSAVCFSKDVPFNEYKQFNRDSEFFANAIFSLIPSNKLTFSKEYQNISSDAALIKNLLLNKRTAVYLPYKLAQKTFDYKKNRYKILENYEISHLILFKTKLPFQKQLVEHIKSNLNLSL